MYKYSTPLTNVRVPGTLIHSQIQKPYRLHCKSSTQKEAAVVELVDTHDSKSCASRHVGSIPTSGTTQNLSRGFLCIPIDFCQFCTILWSNFVPYTLSTTGESYVLSRNHRSFQWKNRAPPSHQPLPIRNRDWWRRPTDAFSAHLFQHGTEIPCHYERNPQQGPPSTH